jgi:hypothetical protein
MITSTARHLNSVHTPLSNTQYFEYLAYKLPTDSLGTGQVPIYPIHCPPSEKQYVPYKNILKRLSHKSNFIMFLLGTNKYSF